MMRMRDLVAHDAILEAHLRRDPCLHEFLKIPIDGDKIESSHLSVQIFRGKRPMCFLKPPEEGYTSRSRTETYALQEKS